MPSQHPNEPSLKEQIAELMNKIYEIKLPFDLYLATVHDWAEDTIDKVETLLRQYRRREESLYNRGRNIIDAAQSLHNQVWDSSSKFMQYGYNQISLINEKDKTDEELLLELTKQLEQVNSLVHEEKQTVEVKRKALCEYINLLHQDLPKEFLSTFKQSLPQILELPDLDKLPFLPGENVYHPSFICSGIGGGDTARFRSE